MIIGIGTPSSQSKIPRPTGPSPLSYFNPPNVRFYYWFRADELLHSNRAQRKLQGETRSRLREPQNAPNVFLRAGSPKQSQELRHGGNPRRLARAARQSRRAEPQNTGGSESGHESGTRGGSHEQHVKTGEQSRKNTGGSESGHESGTRGGSHEQHVKAGEQSRKNTGGSESGHESGTRGGSHEQHVKAGQQSHKNT